MSLNCFRLQIYHGWGCLPCSPVKLLLRDYLPPVSVQVFFNYCGLNLPLAVGLGLSHTKSFSLKSVGTSPCLPSRTHRPSRHWKISHIYKLLLYLSFPVLKLLFLLSRDVLMSHGNVVLVQLSGFNTVNPFQYKTSNPIEKYNKVLWWNVTKISPWWLRKVNQRR